MLKIHALMILGNMCPLNFAKNTKLNDVGDITAGTCEHRTEVNGQATAATGYRCGRSQPPQSEDPEIDNNQLSLKLTLKRSKNPPSRKIDHSYLRYFITPQY